MASAYSLLTIWEDVRKEVWDQAGPSIDSITIRMSYKVGDQTE